jgi:hypothetical protein
VVPDCLSRGELVAVQELSDYLPIVIWPNVEKIVPVCLLKLYLFNLLMSHLPVNVCL